MKKILVAYYSRTGHVQQLAEEIAVASGADIESIHCHTNYKGLIGYWRAARGAITKKPADINPTKHDPADYDLLVLGTPVWASSLPPPVRRYLIDLGSWIKQLAVFCAQGGSGGENLCTEIEALCNKEAVAALIVLDKELKSGEAEERIAGFISVLQQEVDEPGAS